MGVRTWLGLKRRRPPAPTATGSLDGRRTDEPGTVIDESFFRPTFAIDVVYTWVDASDPGFRKSLERHRGAESPASALAGLSRFTSHDELRYSLRSLESFAPWVNHIYIVTGGQRPAWLAPHPKISLVHHETILDPGYLPTFNSHVIESALHRIPGLSEHYIYFNDDVMLLRPITPGDAFTANGLAFGFIGDVELDDTAPQPFETATHWAAKNARERVRSRWGQALDRRFAHSFQPQLKTVAEDCDRLFEAELSAFRGNKFRQMNDLLCCSYLYPVVAYLTGRGVFSHTSLWYLKIRDPSAVETYASILAERGSAAERMAVCLNDYAPSKDRFPAYGEHLHAFLEACFPNRSSFELAPRDAAATDRIQAAR